MGDAHTQPPPRASRRLGVLRHTFPEFTPVEKGFLFAFVACGILVVLMLRNGARTSGFWIVAISACVMGTTLGYWMRHEPAACLDLLVSWYSIPTGRLHDIKWPRVVLFCVRAFGFVAFFGTLASFSMALLPDNWTSSPAPASIFYGTILAVGYVALRKRPRARTRT